MHVSGFKYREIAEKLGFAIGNGEEPYLFSHVSVYSKS